MPASPAYRTNSTLYDTSVAATFGSARATQVTTTADYSVNHFHGGIAPVRDLTTYGAGVNLARALSRSAGVSVAYHYSTGDFAVGGMTQEHRVTIGADYSLALSRTRRATLHIDLSPSIVETPAAAGSREQQSHLQGEARFEYPVRPKWRAVVTYSRALDYVAGLTEPTLSNGTTAEVTGVIGYHVDLLAMAGYATGSSAVSANRQDVGTSTGQIRIRYALTRNYALYL